MQTVFLYFSTFIFGLFLGSFLNAFVWRLHKGESIVTRFRSYCIRCNATLQARDLIPLLSFLVLRGRCRFCKGNISPQYPLMELATGMLFAFSAWSVLGLSPEPWHASQMMQVAVYWFFVSVLLILFVYDFKYSILPDAVSLPAIVVAFLLNLFLGFSWWSMLLAAVVGGGFFLAQFILSKGRWIGGGDARLGALMGVMLGWPHILVALFLAYVSGAAFGIGVVSAKKMSMKSQIPFGTFLAGATIVTLFYGEQILGWYMGMLGG